MGTNILILDIGNTNTKCYVFDVQQPQQEPAQKIQAIPIYEEHQETNRGQPWDLVDTARNMLIDAIKLHNPQVGMITAFGDAFVEYRPSVNHRPRFVFADEQVPFVKPIDYQSAGFPDGNIGITGVHALRKKHQAKWENIIPINIFLATELCRKEGWRNWDIPQASATGDYNIRNQNWVSSRIPVCQPSDEIGIFKDNPIAVRTAPAFQEMPLLAGGLDNAFLDTTEQTPYIVAGTWLVVSTIHDDFRPTQTQRQHGVRWLVSGNGRYLAQTVRRSESPLSLDLPKRILEDFQAMGLGGGEHQKIRVFGSYAKELSKKLNAVAAENYFDFQFQNYDEQHRQAAIYVYKKKLT